MSSKGAFAKDTIIYGLGQGIKKFIGIFLLPFYTRALNPEQYGILNTITTVMFLISAILELGLNTARGFYYFQAEGKDKKQVLYSLFIFRILTISPSFIPALFSDRISLLLFRTAKYKWPIFIALILIPINLLMSEQSHVYRYLRKPWGYNLVTLVKILSNIVFGIGLVVVLHYGVLGAMLANIFSSSIVVLFSFIYFTRKVYEYRFNRDIFKKMLKFGFPLIWAELAAWVDNSSDRFFLLHYSTLKEIGYYSIGTTFSQPILLLNMAVQMSFGVLFYKTYNEETDIDKKESKKLASDSFNLYLVVGVAIAAVLSIFSEDLVRFVTTAKYVKGAAAVPFLTFSYIAAQAYQVMGPGITLAEKTWYYTWLTIGSALLNILLNFVFIPKWGFVGAAASTLVSFVAYWLVKLKISLKFFYIPYRFKSIFLYYFISLGISLFFPLKYYYDGYKAPFSIKFLFILFILVLPLFLKLIEIADIKKLYKKVSSILFFGKNKKSKS